MNARIPSSGYREETGELAFRGPDGKLVWMSPDSVAASVKDGSLRPDGTVRDVSAQPPEVSQNSAPKGDAEMALAEYDKANPPTPATRSPAAATPPHPALQALRARAQPKVDVRPTVSGPMPVRPFESLLPSRAPQEPAAVVPPAEDGFAAAQDAARRSRLLAGLARAGATAVGRGADPGLAALDKNADAPMADYKAEQAHGEAVKADARKASDADPASPQSALARQVMTQVVPGLADVKGFEKLSYARLMTDPMFEKYAGLVEKRASAGGTLAEKNANLERERIQNAETARHNRATEQIGWANANRERGGGAAAGDEKSFMKLKDDLSTTRARNLQGSRQDVLDRADRLEALIGKPGTLENATPQQVREAATALAAVISKSSAAVSQVEALVPQTLVGDWANFKQKILNAPQSAEAKAFLENMLATTAREKQVVTGQIRKAQGQVLPAYNHLRASDPVRFDAMVRAAGLDPTRIGGTGEYQEPAPATSAERVRMRSPDGVTGTVSAAKAAEKEAKGWTRL